MAFATGFCECPTHVTWRDRRTGDSCWMCAPCREDIYFFPVSGELLKMRCSKTVWAVGNECCKCEIMRATLCVGPRTGTQIKTWKKNSQQSKIWRISVQKNFQTHASNLQNLMRTPFREDLNRKPTRSSHKDRYKIMPGPLRWFQHDLHKKDANKIMQWPNYKTICQDLHKIFTKQPAQDHARTSQRGLYQDVCKISSQGPVQNHARTSQKGFHQDPHKIFA